MYKKLIKYLSSGIIVLFILFLPESCSFSSDQLLLQNGHTGGLLKDIKARGTLVALTDDNSFNYFSYNGESHGLQYDLLKKFADYLGVSLKIIVEPDAFKAIQYLQQRKVDIIAMELPRISIRNYNLIYTDPLYSDYQVLVQKKPDHWLKTNNLSRVNDQLVTSTANLKDKTITLSANKQVQYYLSDIQHSTNNQISLNVERSIPVTNLIQEVSNGNVEYCIAYENTVKAMMYSYPNLDAHTRVSPAIEISWIVRKGSINLLEEANSWIKIQQENKFLKKTQAKYCRNPRMISLALGKPLPKSSISDYDQVVREMSKKIGWDWRLVSALIYQESRFKTNATSYRGAFGIMQLMPSTASRFGAHAGSTANEQIAAGIRLINYLDKRLSNLVPNDNERQKFVLAAYNIGLAHIIDAINLTDKYNKNPEVWFDNVEYFLLAKSQPQYYNDSIVKHGRISGKETHQFVIDVMDRYEHYKTLALK